MQGTGGRPRLVACLLAALIAAGGCGGADGAATDTTFNSQRDASEKPDEAADLDELHEEGRLTARPAGSVGGTASFGFETFSGGHGYRYAPRSYPKHRPVPLVLALPGGGGDVRGAVERIVPYADRTGAIVLGFRPIGAAWDYIVGGYGPDITFIDRTLADTFDRYAIDPARVGVVGFSNGATYALSIGTTNGDLFRHVVAFSPGFADTSNPNGSPSFFITHGTQDRTLPIEQTSRRIVPELEDMGYDVAYHEFTAGHDIPNDLVPEALGWLQRNGG